jgi:hypothetical protein
MQTQLTLTLINFNRKSRRNRMWCHGLTVLVVLRMRAQPRNLKLDSLLRSNVYLQHAVDPPESPLHDVFGLDTAIPNAFVREHTIHAD